MRSAQFLSVMEQMIPEGQLRNLCEYFAPRPRTARKLSTEQLVTGLVFHQLQPGGTLADHSGRLHGIRMSDSAYAQRRQHLPVELFEQIMTARLRRWLIRNVSRRVSLKGIVCWAWMARSGV